MARRRELVEREKQRRAEAAARRSAELKDQHRKLIEKQKNDRINKGRQQWRSNLLGNYACNGIAVNTCNSIAVNTRVTVTCSANIRVTVSQLIRT